jgi:hypothetical protein
MRIALLLLLAAAPLRAQSVCWYDHRARTVESVEPYCKDGQLVFYKFGANYDPSCGVRNTFNLFGELCADPCKSALKGIKNYPKFKKKIVIFGPALLPLSPSEKYAFAAYEGTCSDLRDKLYRREKSEFEPITDDDLIKAAGLK